MEISVIIPAFQEEERIGYTIEKLASYLDASKTSAEIVLVLDGCTDQTEAVAQAAIVNKKCIFNIIKLPTNCGKGFAVKQGMLKAAGQYLFFTDADLSFAPNIIPQFLERLKAGADIVIAQRQKSSTYSHIVRRLLATFSRAIIGNFVVPGIRDTQAGFKAFRQDVARALFTDLKIPGYLFDLELLLIAKRRGYRIEKVYVDWSDRPGSKVRPFKDALRAANDLVAILLRNLFAQAKSNKG